MKKWTQWELFFIHVAVFDIQRFHFSIYSQIKLLKETVLKNRSWESIRQKINRERK